MYVYIYIYIYILWNPLGVPEKHTKQKTPNK